MGKINLIFKLKSLYFLFIFGLIFIFTSFLLNIKPARAAGGQETIVPVGSYGIYGTIASYGSYGQYGNPATMTTIAVDKFVGILPKDVTNCADPRIKYVDNFLSSDPRLKPDQEFCFKINIKNTSNSNLDNVKAQDFVPQFLNPIEGPGNFSRTDKLINFDAGNFDINQEKPFFIKMKIVPQDTLPADMGILCFKNRAVASTDIASDEDSSQVCVEK